MNKLALAMFLVLFVIPLASAFPCEHTINQTYCEQIADEPLNESEKDQVYSTLLYSNSDYPDHEFIQDYTLALVVDEPPHNTTVYNSVQIKNAWMSFLSVFPSIIEDNILYVHNRTNVLSEYDYDVYVPPDYISPGYPRKYKGDCERYHTLVQNSARLNYYLNAAYVTSGKYSSIGADSGIIDAELKIKTKIEVEHHKWYKYCCARTEYGCIRYCYKCKYHHTDFESDQVIIEESKNVTLYSREPSAFLQFVDNYYGTTQGECKASNLSKIKS